MPTPPRFHAFISYSHQSDARVAAALQSALQRVGKRWYQRSKVRVFRDQTNLAAAPGLWDEIERNLADTAWFILLASPTAAASPWVAKEVQWWLDHRSPDTLLVALTGGELQWSASVGRFDAALSSSAPPPLLRAFAAEPLWVDLRFAAAEPRLSLRHARFRDAALTFAARLHGRPKDELDSAEIREHRRLLQAGAAAALLLNVAIVGAGFQWYAAQQQRQRAEANWREAQSRRLADEGIEAFEHGDIDRAIQLVVLAWRLDRTQQAKLAMLRLVEGGGAVSRVMQQHASGVAALAITADSRRLLSVGNDASLQLWDLARGGERVGDMHVPPPVPGAPSNERDQVSGASVSADGRTALAWHHGGRFWWWDLAHDQVQRVELPHGNDEDSERLLHAQVDPTGSGVLLGGRGRLALWRPGQPLQEAPLGMGGLRSVGACFLGPQRVRVLVGDTVGNGTLRLLEWNLADGQVRQGQPMKLRSGMVAEPVFSSNCSGLVVWDAQWVRVLRVDEGLHLAEVALPAGALADYDGRVYARFDASGEQLLLAVNGNGGLQQYWKWQRWNLRAPSAPAEAGRFEGVHSHPVISPDGRWFAGVTLSDIVLRDLQSAAHTPQQRALDAGCSTMDDSCADRLCRKGSRTLDQEALRRLFGIADYEVFYDTYRKVIDAAVCRPQG